MICRLMRRRLGAYHDGELTPGARARIDAHLEGCARCAAELAAIRKLHAALAPREVRPEMEPPEPVWEAFWPQVRARLATPERPEPRWRWAWGGLVRPRYVAAPALAGASLAVLAVVAPWGQQGTVGRGTPAPGSAPDLMPEQVVIQSIETDDPEAPVMVYSTPESDVTVVWVFGLERTGT